MRAFFARLGGSSSGNSNSSSGGSAAPGSKGKDPVPPPPSSSSSNGRVQPPKPLPSIPHSLASVVEAPIDFSPAILGKELSTSPRSTASSGLPPAAESSSAARPPVPTTSQSLPSRPSRAISPPVAAQPHGRAVSGGHIPPPASTEPLKSSTATRPPGQPSTKAGKMVAFTTPTTPEPVLALTGEPVNPRPTAVTVGTGKSSRPPLRTGRSSTTPSTTVAASSAVKASTTGRATASAATTKAPLGSALRLKKGSSTTPPGASSSSLKAPSRSSSTPSAPPVTQRTTSSATTSRGETSRLKRPELSRPLSVMSDSTAFTGATSAPATHGDDSFISAHGSWSQWADEDLLMNLGPRERTRQEVLWEIVSSEERYVVDLQNLVETFVDSLLPPQNVGSPSLDQWTPPLGTTSTPSTSWGSPVSESLASPRSVSAESNDPLPIAARFQQSSFMNRQVSDSSAGSSSSGGGGGGGAAGHPSTPAFGTHEFDSFVLNSGKPFLYDTLHRPHPLGALKPLQVPYPEDLAPARNAPPMRSHQSLPPPNRSSIKPTPTSQPVAQRAPSADLARRRPSAAPTKASTMSHADVIGLPDELREILEVIRDGILPGHLALSKALKARHEEQFPLVRSLADVFNQHSFVLREYNAYVLHLSDALGIVDSALSSSSVGSSRKLKKAAEGDESARLHKVFQELDELAADKGESGLAISLSKPFQRLLKYPLLLQNLLFHTDPSTKEYEATLGMVEEVEEIIRSIEDEKTAVEERITTRDVLARIDGLEREKMLMVPRPNRLLQEEYPTGSDGARLSAPVAARRQVPVKTREKKVSRRLSDMLKPSSSTSNDLWVVRFTDVCLLCQRTGTTTLPLAATATRSSSLPDLHGKAKFATVGGRRAQQTPRNLYRLVRVQEWTIADPTPAHNDMVLTEDINRRHSCAPGEPTSAVAASDPAHGNEELDSDDSFDAKSRMSFSYWGGDKVEPVPLPDGRATSASRRAGASSTLSQSPRAPIALPPNIARRSSAQEKFGSRLRSPEPTAHEGRAASRTRPAATSANTKRAATPAARPAWNSNVTAPPAKPRTLSASNLPAVVRPSAMAKKSSTPSEDIASLYRSTHGR